MNLNYYLSAIIEIQSQMLLKIIEARCIEKACVSVYNWMLTEEENAPKEQVFGKSYFESRELWKIV